MTCRYCGGAKRIQIVSSVSDHAWADCFCNRPEQAVPSFTEAMVEVGQASEKQLRQALTQATLSLLAIGHPEPNDPPDARVCGIMARGAIVRMGEALTKEST